MDSSGSAMAVRFDKQRFDDGWDCPQRAKSCDSGADDPRCCRDSAEHGTCPRGRRQFHTRRPVFSSGGHRRPARETRADREACDCECIDFDQTGRPRDQFFWRPASFVFRKRGESNGQRQAGIPGRFAVLSRLAPSEPSPEILAERLNDELRPVVQDVIRLTPNIVEIVVRAPIAARAFKPGQFYRLQNYESLATRAEGTTLAMEGLALTGA